MTERKIRITLELPPAVLMYLRKAEANLQQYLEHSLLDVIRSDIDTYEGKEWPFPSEKVKEIVGL